MKCSKVRDILMVHAAGELSPGEAGDIQAHLEVCEPCRAEYEKARQASAMLMGLRAEEPSPDLIGAVRRKLAAPAPRTSTLRLSPLAAALAVPALVVLVVAGWLWQRPNDTTREQMLARPGHTQSAVSSGVLPAGKKPVNARCAAFCEAKSAGKAVGPPPPAKKPLNARCAAYCEAKAAGRAVGPPPLPKGAAKRPA